jgi:hypothetical protein
VIFHHQIERFKIDYTDLKILGNYYSVNPTWLIVSPPGLPEINNFGFGPELFQVLHPGAPNDREGADHEGLDGVAPDYFNRHRGLARPSVMPVAEPRPSVREVGGPELMGHEGRGSLFLDFHFQKHTLARPESFVKKKMFLIRKYFP